MIQSIEITNSQGNTLVLNLRTSFDDHGLQVFNLTGLGSPKATVSGLSGPTYDGITGEFVRTDARQLLLTLAIPVRGDAEETAKKKVYDFFPVKGVITFNVITDTRDVYVSAIVESVEMNQFSKVENAVISLYCADPYFLEMVEYQRYPTDPVDNTITYEGDVPTGCLITVIFGQEAGSPLTVTNDNGNQSMVVDLTATGGMSIGDTIYIDTRFGQKSIIHKKYTGALTDLISGVSPTTNWIELRPGDNNIAAVPDSLGGFDPDMPDPSDMVVFLPFNEQDGGKAIDLHLDTHDKYDFSRYGVVGADTGYVYLYPLAREFIPSNLPYFYGPSGLEIFCPGPLDFAITFWAKAKSYETELMTNVLGGDNGIFIQTHTSGLMQLGILSDGGPADLVSISMGTLDTWSCYFCWFDSSAEISYISRNGGAPVSNPGTLAPLTYSSRWRIGGSGSQYWDGQIQSLAYYYNTFFSSAERAFYYKSGYGRTYAEATGTVEVLVHYRPRYQGV